MDLDERERIATLLEREARLLRRGDFEVYESILQVDEEQGNSSRHVCIRLRYDSGPVVTVPTLDEYQGRSTARSYDSRYVEGRWALAYRSAHHPDDDIWYLRVHQRDDSHVGEVWFGGCVLTNAGGGFFRMSREGAIRAADDWAHHGELPEHASTR